MSAPATPPSEHTTENTPRGLSPDTKGPTITIGEILVEIMAADRGIGFLEPLTLTGPYPSGAPAIFIDQCARAGGSAGIIATVGDDDFGRVNTDRLERDGVDISAVAVDPAYPTGSAFVRYRPDGSRDFVFNISKSAAARLSLDGPARALIARAGHLHIMGTAFAIPAVADMLEEALATIRANGGSVSVDPNMRKELLQHGQTAERFSRAIAAADLLLPSGNELFVAAGIEGSEEEAVAALFARGVREIALKRGEHGATWFGADGSRVDCAGFEVTEVDPTGAGDCFGGAFVACRRLGMAPDVALDYANAAGARNVTVQGPMEGAGTRAELDAFMASTRRRA